MFEIDKSVIEKATNGDRRSFEKIVALSKDYVWSYSLRYLGNYHLAEDAAQEVFLKIYRGLPNFNSDSKFSSWVYTVTHNTCVDLYRKNKNAGKTASIDNEKEIADSADELSEGQLADILNNLKPEFKQVFAMVTIFGFSYKEAARHIGCTASAVKSRIYRARQEIIKMLEKDAMSEV